MVKFEIRAGELATLSWPMPGSFEAAWYDDSYRDLMGRWAWAAQSEGSYAWGSMLFVSDYQRIRDTVSEGRQFDAAAQLFNAYLAADAPTPAGIVATNLQQLMDQPELAELDDMDDDDYWATVQPILDEISAASDATFAYLETQYDDFVASLSGVIAGGEPAAQERAPTSAEGELEAEGPLLVEPAFDADLVRTWNKSNIKGTENKDGVFYIQFGDKLFIGRGHEVLVDYWERTYAAQGLTPSRGMITLHRARFRGAGSVAVTGCHTDDRGTFIDLMAEFSEKEIEFAD